MWRSQRRIDSGSRARRGERTGCNRKWRWTTRAGHDGQWIVADERAERRWRDHGRNGECCQQRERGADFGKGRFLFQRQPDRWQPARAIREDQGGGGAQFQKGRGGAERPSRRAREPRWGSKVSKASETRAQVSRTTRLHYIFFIVLVSRIGKIRASDAFLIDFRSIMMGMTKHGKTLKIFWKR